jgi:chromosome segregation ATPase
MVTVKSQNKYQSLYVTVDNGVDKKKEVLKIIKNVLLLQKEIERILKLRRIRSEILADSKEVLFSMNEEIQDLNKNFPNVRNIISFTEKEITTLEKDITFLKDEVKVDEKTINNTRKMIEKMKQIPTEERLKKGERKLEKGEVKKEEVILPSVPKKMTKMDRIENNLKVIEEKLKGL